MIPYRDQKNRNAIYYFVREFERRKRHYPEVSQICRFLCLLDFVSVMKRGLPCIDVFSDNFFIPEEYESPDMDYFSDSEIEIMNRLLSGLFGDEDIYNVFFDLFDEGKALEKEKLLFMVCLRDQEF
jgi:hypothetical protein